jgi:hypothetical protein
MLGLAPKFFEVLRVQRLDFRHHQLRSTDVEQRINAALNPVPGLRSPSVDAATSAS